MKNAGVGDDEDEEGYLDPNDLSIIDDRTWEPSDEEILSYALKLGYDLENDPDELFEVAYYYLKCPLPEGWRRAIYKETKELMYINMEDGEIEIATEIEEMARQAYLEKKEEYLRKIGKIGNNKNEEVNKVVPRKKIPPLNPLGKSTQNGFTNNHLPPLKKDEGKLNLTDNSLSELNNNNSKEDESGSSFLKVDYRKYDNGDINFTDNSENDTSNILNDANIKSVFNKKKDDKKKEEEKKSNKKNEEKKKEDEDEEEDEEEEDEEEEDEEEEEEDEELIKSINNKKNEIKKEDKKVEIKKDDKKVEVKKDDKNVNEVKKEDKKVNEVKKDDKTINEVKKDDKTINEVKKDDNKVNEVKKEEKKENIIKKEETKIKEENKENEIKKDNKIIIKKDDLEKKKKEYFDLKLNELKEFENKVREKYNKDKENYKKNKEEFQEKYDKKFEEEMKKEKNKIDKQINDKISLYEIQLKNNNDKEINKYKKETENEIKKNYNKNESNDKKDEEQLLNLTKKKNNLMSDLEKSKKLSELNKSKKKELDESLRKSKNLLEEKNKIQKSNILKKHELNIKELENNLEQDFIKNKNIISEKLNPNKSVEVTNFLVNKNSQLYENYQKALDDEYEINCKALKQELTLNRKKDLDDFANSMIIEKNEKIKQYQKDIGQLENDYFESLNNIRENSKKIANQTDEMLKEKFNGTLENYDKIKKKLIDDDEEFINKFIHKLKEFIDKENNIDKIELLTEEFLYELKGDINLEYQKYKNSYDLLENEYKYKMLSLNYLIEITNNIIKTTIDTTNKEINNDEIIQNIIKYSKDKLTTYKFKFSKEKDTKLYSFLKNLKLFDSNKINKRDFHYSDMQKSFEQNVIQLPMTNEKSRFSNFIPSERYTEPNNTQQENEKIIKEEENNQIVENLNSNNNNLNNLNILNNVNELDVYVIDTNKNITIPLLPDFYLRQLDTEEISLYTDITLFLKNEYIKIDNINKYGTINPSINVKLNLLILDKIKLYTEDTFNFIQKNISNRKNKIFFKEKLQLLVNNIGDYRKNFFIDENQINRPPSTESYYKNQNNIEQNYNNLTNINPIISEDKMNLTSKSFNYNLKRGENKKKEIESEKSNFTSYIPNSKIKENKIFEPSDSMRISGRFNRFYTNYNPSVLGNGLNTPFSHEFFNYKKNKYELDSKLSMLKYK